jgi:hypothetical protein
MIMKNIGKLLIALLASSVMVPNVQAGSDAWIAAPALVGGMAIGAAMQKREKVVVVQPQAPVQQPSMMDREYGYLRGALDESRNEKARLENENRRLEEEKRRLEEENQRLMEERRNRK